MLFNSVTFFIYFIIVFLLYWIIIPQKKFSQNLLILVASYIFYGWWDYRFLSLIVLSSLIDYFTGLKLENLSDQKSRKFYLSVSILFNLGMLGVFKYYNFFVESLLVSMQSLGIEFQYTTLNIILPVGISFYTFQTMSYTIDIYFKKIKATRDMLQFFVFVSYFPQLVAGPIERAKNLLPQFQNVRVFNYQESVLGMQLVLSGFIKKCLIADNLSVRVDYVFANYQELHPIFLYLGIVFFAIQIYCDFSGYSEIAIGISKMLNINLMYNFRTPYFSTNINEFWQRWHISLSTWFRDYVYIPLGGNRCSTSRFRFNIFMTFLLSGLWHGANLTYVVWGMLHSLYYVIYTVMNKKESTSTPPQSGYLYSMKMILNWFITFHVVLIAWVFFRSISFHQSIMFFSYGFMNLFADSSTFLEYSIMNPMFRNGIIFCSILLLAEWFQRNRRCIYDIGHLPWMVRWGLYYIGVILFIIKGEIGYVPFIYFQF